MPLSPRASLYATEGSLIEYEFDSGLLWWDSVPIGRLVDSPLAVEPVKRAVERLHRADVEAIALRHAKLAAAAQLKDEGC